MMVTFVSQCEKHALKRTRRVLDAFANRIGDNTWQTLITEDGLQTVKKMLNQSASRSTAVSCHWIRSRSRSQLLWVVGRKNKFNEQGYVPVNRTEKSLLGSELENNWKYLSLINALTRLAALLHDWGKASRLFQDKLNPAIDTPFKGDPLRHEWISSLLFSSLVKSQENPENDESWLETLMSGQWSESQLQQWVQQNKAIESPLANLPDAASLIAWLIVSHHRLPFVKDENKKNQLADSTRSSLSSLLKTIEKNWGYENFYDELGYQQRLNQCFEFPNGLLSDSVVWLQGISKAAEHLIHQLPLFKEAMANGCWKLIAQQARLCLMLGDHNYSSKGADVNWESDVPLYANTHRMYGAMQFKQKLDEHLVNVAEVASNVAEYLPFFESEPLPARDIEKLKYIKSNGKFSWQEDAVKEIVKYKEANNDSISGFFVVNMASTGCGKTLANAKIMQALSEDKQSLRFILALGLRTLTLQTGDEYRERVGLSESELAVLIGSKAVSQLHNEANEIRNIKNDAAIVELNITGSDSQESLFGDEGEELLWAENAWQGILPEEELSTVLTRPKDRALLYAPVLACTIDHIMGATETLRGGRYILPYLRLMSSDLVIDEIDDFINKDAVAIGRLVHLAGLLGRKVMIASATITPDIALFYFQAYQSGWVIHAKSRQQSRQIGCIWVDEGKYDKVKDICKLSTHIATIMADGENSEAALNYQQHHDKFIDKRVIHIKAQPARRKARIISTPPDSGENNKVQYFQHIQNTIIEQHNSHFFIDDQTDIHISFGVVRVANISLCVELTRYLLECELPDDIEIRTMAYHSQQVLLLRHEQEQHLDSVLKRKEKPDKPPFALNNAIIRQHIEQTKSEKRAKHLIFVLVATPVEEVGRDHDFDWAVIEPSSYRSIIQMAGRVRRHREGEVEKSNIALLQYNWKGFSSESNSKDKKRDVFSRPGYENSHLKLTLETHDLHNLVDEKQLLMSVDAIARIQKVPDWEQKKFNNLASFEHYAIQVSTGIKSIFSQKSAVNKSTRSRTRIVSDSPNTALRLWGYTHGCWWMTALPQQLTPFRQSMPSVRLSFSQMNDGEWKFCEYDKDSGWVPKESGADYTIVHRPLNISSHKRLWLVRDYVASIEQREIEDGRVKYISRLYGEISFILFENHEYHYDDQLGMVAVKA